MPHVVVTFPQTFSYTGELFFILGKLGSIHCLSQTIAYNRLINDQHAYRPGPVPFFRIKHTYLITVNSFMMISLLHMLVSNALTAIKDILKIPVLAYT